MYHKLLCISTKGKDYKVYVHMKCDEVWYEVNSDKLNFRPWSIVSIIYKVFKSLLHEQISKYFEINNIIWNTFKRVYTST